MDILRLENLAREYLNRAQENIDSDGKYRTKILNAAYNMGKYHAIGDLIFDIDAVTFRDFVENTKGQADRIIKYIS